MALYNDFGVLTSEPGILQPKLKNRWRVRFFGVTAPRGSASVGLGNATALTVQAITVDLPKQQTEEVQLDRYNSRAWIAAKHMWQPINITFEDDIGGRVSRVLQNQQERQQALTAPIPGRLLNTAAAGQDYKFGMVCEMLDGDQSILSAWAYSGCWINNIDHGDLDYSASETVKIVTTIRFDHVVQDLEGGRSFDGALATGGPGFNGRRVSFSPDF